MSSSERREARTVILRLRRYRDRIEEITTGDGDSAESASTLAVPWKPATT